jgi:endoglucanase
MNPRVVEGLIGIAKTKNMPHQLQGIGRGTGTDANALQVNRAGVAAGLVSIPNRYMHSSVELISLDDIDRAADLLAAYALSLSPDSRLTP